MVRRKTIKRNKKKRKGGNNKSFHKMNCNPKVKGRNVVKDSCFPPETLVLLKESYNKYHPEDKIISTELTEIWEELNKRLVQCSKEDCWLNQIQDANVRKKIHIDSFAPNQPKEWKKNPDEWLSNFDIINVLIQYEKTYKEFHLIGPTPIDFDSRPKDMDGQCVWDELCKFDLEKYLKDGKTKIGIVFNLDKHDKSGSHWVSMFVDLDDKFVFYMDSAGNKIPEEIKKLFDRIYQQGLALQTPIKLEFYENSPLEHQMGNTECGMYTLYFIITMLTGKTEEKIFQNYMEKIKFFKNKRIPDNFMKRYRNIYFNG
jgi:hypothetical protein